MLVNRLLKLSTEIEQSNRVDRPYHPGGALYIAASNRSTEALSASAEPQTPSANKASTRSPLFVHQVCLKGASTLYENSLAKLHPSRSSCECLLLTGSKIGSHSRL